MKSVVNGAASKQRHVSICGDAASDPSAAAVFAGLGIHSLSVRPNQSAEIKALFRELHFTRLEKLATQALQLNDAGEVRALVADQLTATSHAH